MATTFKTGFPATASLSLQRCDQCGWVNYPSRELCGRCLADALRWQPVEDTGTVLSLTELHYSLEPAYAEHLPWTVASIRLDCGPIALAHLAPGVGTNDRVTLQPVQDRSGNRMLLAVGVGNTTPQATSAWLSEVQFREVSA